MWLKVNSELTAYLAPLAPMIISDNHNSNFIIYILCN